MIEENRKFIVEEVTEYYRDACDFLEINRFDNCGQCYRFLTCMEAYLRNKNSKKMKLEIEISKSDYEALCKKSMTVGEMYDTLEGRIFCSIVHAGLYKNK